MLIATIADYWPLGLLLLVVVIGIAIAIASESLPTCHVCNQYLQKINERPIDDQGKPTIPPGATHRCSRRKDSGGNTIGCSPTRYYSIPVEPSRKKIKEK